MTDPTKSGSTTVQHNILVSASANETSLSFHLMKYARSTFSFRRSSPAAIDRCLLLPPAAQTHTLSARRSMPAKSLKEAGPCRNKPKNELTLSPEEQARQDADMKLLKLVEEGNVAEVKTMVDDQKQAVNVGDENGESSVHKCMRIRSPEAATQMLTMLIEAGAFADYADSYGKRPISVCMEQGESEASGLLMDALLGLVDSSGGRVVDLAATNHKTGNTHIHDACWVGNLAAIRALLATGAFNGALEATNKQGRASAKALVARARNRTRCASPRARLAATRGALVFFVLSPGVRFFPSPQRRRCTSPRSARPKRSCKH